jgi:hypothetical protein
MAKKYAKNLIEAKKIFKEKTGSTYTIGSKIKGIEIYKLKNPTNTRKYFVGTYMEWLNK